MDENDPVNRPLFNDDIPFNATPEDVNNIIINHPSNIYGNQIREGVYRIISHVNDDYYIIDNIVDNHNYPETDVERRLRYIRYE